MPRLAILKEREQLLGLHLEVVEIDAILLVTSLLLLEEAGCHAEIIVAIPAQPLPSIAPRRDNLVIIFWNLGLPDECR